MSAATVTRIRVLRLRPEGCLDALTAPTIRGHVLDAGIHAERVIVDLSAVTEMDAAGLSSIVGARRRLRALGVEVTICGALAPSVRHTLAVTRFAQLFDLAAPELA